MLKYTKAAIDKIKEDLKVGVALFEIITLILMLTYLILALSFSFGNLIINIILLVVVSIYFLFYLANLKFRFKWFNSIFKKYYKIIRLIILASSLTITLYELYVTTNEVNPVTIILVTLLIIFWLLQVVIEIIYRLVVNEIDLLLQAIAQDKESALEPVKKIFKEETKPKSKKILRLEKKMEKVKEKEEKSSNKKRKFFKKS